MIADELVLRPLNDINDVTWSIISILILLGRWLPIMKLVYSELEEDAEPDRTEGRSTDVERHF